MANYRLAQPAKRLAVQMSVQRQTISSLEAKREGWLITWSLRVRANLIFVLSYVAALELRIEKLEKRLQFAKSRKASVALHDTDASAFNVQQMDRRDSLALIRAAIHRKAAQKRETSDVNSLVSDFGFL